MIPIKIYFISNNRKININILCNSKHNKSHNIIEILKVNYMINNVYHIVTIVQLLCEYMSTMCKKA